MRTRQLRASDVERSLDFSIEALARDHPELSASRLIPQHLRRALLAVAAVLAGLLVWQPRNTTIGILAVLIVTYVAVTVNRVWLFIASQREGSEARITDEEARAYPDELLPVYTVLVPAYREPEVIAILLRNLTRLEYPREKLDIKLLLEADDSETIEAAVDINPDDSVELVLVPPTDPRTKPKAMNYALATVEGTLLTIYDAEDEPDPLQLRKAAIAMSRLGPEVACVQAKLSYANASQNLITRWFTLEYAMWFELFLPGLASITAPIPLGGTSNHFRVDVLRQLGAWDAHNVTEDADLGFRLARAGYRCEVLDSVTYEEANSDFVNWIKQRSRWYKGYLQTGIVHLRDLRTSWKVLGVKGVGELILFLVGTPLLAMLNALFWLMTLWWFAGQPHLIKELFPAPLYYPAVLSWILGNFVVIYINVLTCRLLKRFDLAIAAMLVPGYWMMMSIAAIKAVYQLVVTPTFWEKTTHGLFHQETIEASPHTVEFTQS